MPAENSLPLEFPHGGVDRSTEFGAQPPGTTAAGENVRSQDPLAELFRGGSRPTRSAGSTRRSST
jgi:hypothetical protein